MSEVILDQYNKNIEVGLKYRDTFCRYLALGNGAAIGITLNYAKEIGTVGNLRTSLFVFAASLSFAVVYWAVASFHAFRAARKLLENEHPSVTRKSTPQNFLLATSIGVLALSSIIFLFGIFWAISNLP